MNLLVLTGLLAAATVQPVRATDCVGVEPESRVVQQVTEENAVPSQSRKQTVITPDAAAERARWREHARKRSRQEDAGGAVSLPDSMLLDSTLPDSMLIGRSGAL